MRSLVVLAITLALAACASAESQQQEKAKILEDRWPQCSQVVNGRLGAFHPFNSDAGQDWAPQNSNSATFPNYDGTVNVNYSPCQPAGNGIQMLSIVDSIDSTVVAQFNIVVPNGDQLVTFTMPTTKGAQANFVGNYIGTYDGSRADAVVVTSCNTRLPDEQIQIESINVTATSTASGTTTNTIRIELESIYACPQFPYTGKSVPAGGVAALVIVILAFIFQFGICAWYHKTQVVDESPFTGVEEAEPVENVQ